MRYWLWFVLFLIPCSLFGQHIQHPILDEAAIRTDYKEVFLSWTISGGNTCNGIEIYRRGDTTATWNLIGEIVGICGNSETAEPYDFTDPTPLANAINYYRIDFGSQGSQLMEIQFTDLSEHPVLVIPNPVISTSQIVFQQPIGETYSLQVYDLNGRLVHENNTVTNGNASVLASDFKKGMYLFRILSDAGMLTGRFQVFR